MSDYIFPHGLTTNYEDIADTVIENSCIKRRDVFEHAPLKKTEMPDYGEPDPEEYKKFCEEFEKQPDNFDAWFGVCNGK